jgi:hypothetical protein
MVYFIPSTTFREAPAVPKPIPSLRICAQSQEFRTILVVSILSGAALNMYAALILVLLSINFGLNNESFAISIELVISIVGTLSGLLCIVLCNWILQKVDKIRVLVMMLFATMVFAVLNFISTLSSSLIYFYVGITIVMSIFAAVSSFLLGLLLRDLVIFDTFVTSKFNAVSLPFLFECLTIFSFVYCSFLFLFFFLFFSFHFFLQDIIVKTCS